MHTATFAAGCFWCIESAFNRVQGVSAVSGYMAGRAEDANYRAVCTGNTDHAEVVQLKFDPAQISYEVLLQMFWFLHDPTQLNRQGNDIGRQYRSAVFYHSDEQRQQTRQSQIAAQQQYDEPIVTELSPATEFYPAESYHQGYFAQNPTQPYCSYLIAPKLQKFAQQFACYLK